MIKYEWRTGLDPQEAAELAALLDRAARHDAEAEHNTIDFGDVERTLASEGIRHLVIWMLPHATTLDGADEPERIAGLVRVVDGDDAGEVTAVIDPELRSIGIMTLLLEQTGVDSPEPIRAWARGNHPAAGRISKRFLVPADQWMWKLVRPLGDTDREPEGVEGTFRLGPTPARSDEFGEYRTIDEFRPAPGTDAAGLRGLLDAAAAAARATGSNAVALHVDSGNRALVNACRSTGFQHDRTDVCYRIGAP